MINLWKPWKYRSKIGTVSGKNFEEKINFNFLLTKYVSGSGSGDPTMVNIYLCVTARMEISVETVSAGQVWPAVLILILRKHVLNMVISGMKLKSLYNNTYMFPRPPRWQSFPSTRFLVIPFSLASDFSFIDVPNALANTYIHDTLYRDICFINLKIDTDLDSRLLRDTNIWWQTRQGKPDKIIRILVIIGI